MGRGRNIDFAQAIDFLANVRHLISPLCASPDFGSGQRAEASARRNSDASLPVQSNGVEVPFETAPNGALPTGYFAAAAFWVVFSPRKATSSGFTISECVHVMQCGPSFTTDRRAPLISWAVRSPEALIGRILSASP
jgi:hypothetical protein